MKIVSIIPARGGSKGIKNKNIINLNGKPLIQYTIDACLNCNEIYETYVSTDDKKIKEISLSLNSKVIDRPIEISRDNSRTSDAIIHALKIIKINMPQVTHFILCQATSPLRNTAHIKEALKLYKQSKCKLLISVYKPDIEIQKSYILNNDGYLTGALNEEYPYMPRQELPEIYLPNGAIYICSINEFIKCKGFPRELVIPYIMDTKHSIDIDQIEDLEKASELLHLSI